jgi:protein glucosyltransferase
LIPEANEYLKLIQDAVSAYKSCSQENCSCYLSVIENDLLPFKSGITEDMINSVKDK